MIPSSWTFWWSLEQSLLLCTYCQGCQKGGLFRGFGLAGGCQKRGLLVWLEWGVGEVGRGAGVKRGVYSSPLYPSISTARAPGVKLRGGQRGDSAICKSQSLRQMYLYLKSICTSQSLKPSRYLYLSITVPLSASIIWQNQPSSSSSSSSSSSPLSQPHCQLPSTFSFAKTNHS